MVVVEFVGAGIGGVLIVFAGCGVFEAGLWIECFDVDKGLGLVCEGDRAEFTGAEGIALWCWVC